MKKLIVFIPILYSLIISGQVDKAGCKEVEPAYMNRMQGFYIQNCEFSEYKDIEFFYVGTDGKSVRVRKAGEYRRHGQWQNHQQRVRCDDDERNPAASRTQRDRRGQGHRRTDFP